MDFKRCIAALHAAPQRLRTFSTLSNSDESSRWNLGHILGKKKDTQSVSSGNSTVALPETTSTDSGQGPRSRASTMSTIDYEQAVHTARMQSFSSNPSLDSSASEKISSPTESETARGHFAVPKLRHVEKAAPAAYVDEQTEDSDEDAEYNQLFQYVFVVSLQKHDGHYQPKVTYRFPPTMKCDPSMVRDEEESLQSIPAFCFPDIDSWTEPVSSYKSETFSFILTDIEGGKRFGYCRRMLPSGSSPRLPEVYCIISPLGCFSLYSTVLDMVEQRRTHSPTSVYTFLKAVIAKPFPAPGRSVTVQSFAMSGVGMEEVVLRRPNDSAWLEHVDFDILFSQLSYNMVIKVFTAMLLERHLIFVAERLSTLSSCILAVTALLYPFEWQHVFIPVLPVSLIDICCSPMPYVIGMMRSSLPTLQSGDLPMEDDVLIVDLDQGKFLSSAPVDLSLIPNKLRTDLEASLKGVEGKKARSPQGMASHPDNSLVIVEAFINFFVQAVGHYKKHFKLVDNEFEFQRKSFLHAAPKGVNAFLKSFVDTQMFNVFIQERCDTARLSALGEGLFEQRVSEAVGKDDSRSAGKLKRKRLRSQVREFSASSFGKLKKTVTTAKDVLQAPRSSK